MNFGVWNMGHGEPNVLEMNQNELAYHIHNPNDLIRIRVAKVIDSRFLHIMMRDKCALVRYEAVLRINSDFAPSILKGEDRFYHLIVKDLDTNLLPDLIDDRIDNVRFEVARRIEEEYLPRMIDDVFWPVREKVARRIEESYLYQLLNDSNEQVRTRVAKRINPEYLPRLLDDPYEKVRFYVAKRIGVEYLKYIALEDESPDVRAEAERRLRE